MDKNQIIKEAEDYLDSVEKEFESDLAALIEIPSVAWKKEGVYTFGASCAKVLDAAMEMGKKYGFKTENHDYYCASIISGDKKDEIGIVAHLDVVPAGSGWRYEPYKLTVESDKYIGRGTLDDKGPFLCGLYAMRFLKEKGISLPFSIRLIAGSDEEVGSSDLEHFAKVAKPPFFSFTPDAEFPVCIGEKGILQVDVMLGELPPEIAEIGGGTVSNAVPDSAYAVIWDDKSDIHSFPAQSNIIIERLDEKRLKITATGKTAHAAMPESGINAIGILAAYILKNVPVSGKKPFEFLASACGEYFGRTLGIAREDENFKYLTCVGGKLTVSDGIMVQNFNIRYIPDTTYEPVLKQIKDTLTPQGFAVRPVFTSEGYYVSADDKKIKALTEACETVLGYECKPYTMGGGTYARWLANTVAFGASIQEERGKFGEGRGDAHQRDEYISKAEVRKTILIYIRSILNLAEICSEN